MIFFHVISGSPPGGNTVGNPKAMETSVDTSRGQRPSFEFLEYQLLPQVKHLETSMTNSWQENPDSRMSAEEILKSMSKPGFSCLCDYIAVESVRSGCVAHMVNTNIPIDTHFINPFVVSTFAVERNT